MERSIGIDLGTTNTVVSYIDKKGKLKTIKFGRNMVLPSVIYFMSKSEYIFGENAIERGFINPKAFVRNFKSMMGSKEKINIVAENGDKLFLNGRELAKILLGKIIDVVTDKFAKEFPGDYVGRAIITVPSKFSVLEKDGTKWAAKKAGIDEVKLAPESTAAAIAYAYENDLEKRVLVYDFGGGTFDVSIIEKKGDKYVDVVTPGGDKNLGGNTLTMEIEKYLLKKIEKELDVEMPYLEEDFDENEFSMTREFYKKNKYKIYEEANLIKEKLSEGEEEVILIPIELSDNVVKNFEMVFTREILTGLIEKHIEKTIQIIDNTIKENFTKEEIGTIVLAGGSSLIPLIREKIENYFQKSIYSTEDTATLISRGAAVLTKIIDGTLSNESILANDIGVETNDGNMNLGVFTALLKAGTPFSKASVSKYFYLNENNQSKITIRLFERDIKNYPNAKYTRHEGCDLLEDIVIQLPKDIKKNEVKIKLTLTITEEGIMNLNVNLEDNLENTIKTEELLVERGSILE